jgi:hypothetical protein
MKKRIKKIGLILCIIMFTMAFITPIQAEEETTGELEDVPVVQLFIVTDGDFITIGDSDRLGEMEAGIEYLGTNIQVLNEKLNTAQASADNAYGLAASAYGTSLVNKDQIDENSQTLVLHYDKLTDTVDKLWILRDEVVAFEGHYFKYVNETDNTLLMYGDSIQLHGDSLLLQEDDINDLRAKYNNLSGIIALVRNTLIGLGIVVGGLFLFNRRYPFAQIRRNGKEKFRENGQQHSIVDFNPEAKPVKKGKMQFLRKGFHIRRNPENSPLRFMFSFFHKL